MHIGRSLLSARTSMRGVTAAGSAPARLARAAGLLLGLGVAAAVAPAPAMAQSSPVFLQWFETSWSNIENRTPDVFLSGYGSMWIPSPCLASTGSAGFDPFDRFNLGQPGNETAFGTEQRFRTMVRALQQASVLVYPEAIMNHNGARSSDANFILDGAWPGFYLPGNNPPAPGFPVDFWGDFHDGTTQSQDPGAANYNLWQGDLVSLIDIAQEKNYQLIRQPTTAGPNNIPPGRVRNRPDPANSRFYPDLSLTPRTFVNPGVGGGGSFTMHPFNTGNPAAGTPVAENATGLLMRWNRWMIEDVGVDGFRLDAAKHIPQWFWNQFFDASVFNARTTPDNRRVVPFSFGESVADNAFVQTYIRKDGFGNRDALDLNEAGQLRNINNSNGFGNWQNVLASSIDNQDDGFNNGTQGVHHVFSHDNGSVGDGSNNPPLPSDQQQAFTENAWVVLRTGVPIVYFNGREMAARFSSRGFWPREGNPSALGANNNVFANLTNVDQYGPNQALPLVRLANMYARGDLNIINGTDPVNTSLADVMVFERTNFTAASIVGAVSDSFANGFQVRNVRTTFAPGTRLRELTGAWADTGANGVNFGGSIPQFLVVDANRRITITVPNKRNNNNVQTNRGYVVYGPAAPSGQMSIVGVAGSLAPDSASVPVWARRTAPVDVVTANSFDILVQTAATDANDPNVDNFAVFRINQGFRDFNGNGSFDQPNGGIDAGFERFVTENNPLFTQRQTNPGATTGRYRQTINASLLPEGFNYVTAYVYRNRSDGGNAILTEFRRVIYVDRVAPSVNVLTPGDINTAFFTYRVQGADTTVRSVWVIPNVPQGADPTTATFLTAANQASQWDRNEWRRNLNAASLPAGTNSITIVSQEVNGRFGVQRIENVRNVVGSGDVNRDGAVNLDDLHAIWTLSAGAYVGEADMNRDGSITLVDQRLLELQLRGTEANLMRGSQR